MTQNVSVVDIKHEWWHRLRIRCFFFWHDCEFHFMRIWFDLTFSAPNELTIPTADWCLRLTKRLVNTVFIYS